jgi:hypothetical protein
MKPILNMEVIEEMNKKLREKKTTKINKILAFAQKVIIACCNT